MAETTGSRLIGISARTLLALRASVMSGSDTGAAVEALQQAGHSGGTALHEGFERWIAESNGAAGGESSSVGEPATNPASLPVSRFAELVGRFFNDAGWGDVSFSSDDNEGPAIVDIARCWECGGTLDRSGSDEADGCHITTGMLAAFFSVVASYPVAVLEAECVRRGGSRCRFVLGSAELINYKWESMQ